MGFGAKRTAEGIEWEVYNTAYGWIGGTAADEDAARVAMYIAERELFEEPLLPVIVAEMRANPARYINDLSPIEEAFAMRARADERNRGPVEEATG